jgi:hypothetical protein
VWVPTWLVLTLIGAVAICGVLFFAIWVAWYTSPNRGRGQHHRPRDDDWDD